MSLLPSCPRAGGRPGSKHEMKKAACFFPPCLFYIRPLKKGTMHMNQPRRRPKAAGGLLPSGPNVKASVSSVKATCKAEHRAQLIHSYCCVTRTRTTQWFPGVQDIYSGSSQILHLMCEQRKVSVSPRHFFSSRSHIDSDASWSSALSTTEVSLPHCTDRDSQLAANAELTVS